jgi:hypothetical protein
MAVWARTGASKKRVIRLAEDSEEDDFDERSESVLLTLTAGTGKRSVLDALAARGDLDLSPIGRLSTAEDSAEDYRDLVDWFVAEEDLPQRQAVLRANEQKRKNAAAWQSPEALVSALRMLESLCAGKVTRALDAQLRRTDLQPSELTFVFAGLADRVEHALRRKATAVRLVIDPWWM